MKDESEIDLGVTRALELDRSSHTKHSSLIFTHRALAKYALSARHAYAALKLKFGNVLDRDVSMHCSILRSAFKFHDRGATATAIDRLLFATQ